MAAVAPPLIKCGVLERIAIVRIFAAVTTPVSAWLLGYGPSRRTSFPDDGPVSAIASNQNIVPTAA